MSSNNLSTSIVITNDILNEKNPIPGLLTQVHLAIRYSCENGDERNIIPMSKFMDEDFRYKGDFSKVYTHYLKQIS